MDIFNDLVYIAIIAFILAIIAQFLGWNFAYWVRNSFTYRDPDLRWDPSAGLPSAWATRRAPNLDASDWGDRAFD